jgi:catechol 2,3-dioxygenase-like lactoylglutathione lyase family enzyme
LIDGYTDVAVVVSNAQEAKKWYVEKLGFKVVLDRGHVICVSPNVREENALRIHLCGDNFAPLEPGNTGIGLTADDFDKNCNEMSSKGIKFSQEPTDEDGYKTAKFLDQDGNEFWLFESSLAKKIMEEEKV